MSAVPDRPAARRPRRLAPAPRPRSAPPGPGWRGRAGIRFVLLHLGLMLGHLLVLFNSGAFASLTLHASGDLGVAPSHGTSLTTYYFVGLALALPTAGWLSGRFGERRLFVLAMLGVALGSGLCALAEELAPFVAGRILQGFCGGAALPVSQSLLMREYPVEERPFALSLWSIAALSPFTLGPVAGGWLADRYGWRALFYLNPPLALLSAGLALTLLVEHRPAHRPGQFDGIGFALLALALFCLQTVLNRGQDEDWYHSPRLIALAGIGLAALLAFLVWAWGERYPLVDLRLFARRNFAIGTLALSLGFLLMYGLLSLLLVRLQSVAGYTALWAGASLVPLALLAKPAAVVLHRLVQRYDARLLASVDLGLFAVFCLWTSGYDFFGRLGWFTGLLGSQVLEGLCLGCLFVPLTALFLSDLPPRRQIQAAELSGLLRVMAGAVGSSSLGVLWEHRLAFHQNRLTETLNRYDPAVREAVAVLRAQGLDPLPATAQLAQWARQHAAILSLDDAFRWAGYGFLGLAALVWLARPSGRPPRGPAATRQTALEDLVEEP
ncbi:DHA2 family efflux MFS transporter permease subunit [Candidatus Methylocalor cossyra]|uniref:DHA2 family multidrug resistance protein n=1 Tax=Candidatus Methylocalor cossyra TaxID=3108543 RepID=A0ABM9NLZ9_9GAMM